MDVFAPCDPLEVQGVTRLIAASGKPSYLRLSRAGEPVLHLTPPADLRSVGMLRQGNDVTILASGSGGVAVPCRGRRTQIDVD